MHVLFSLVKVLSVNFFSYVDGYGVDKNYSTKYFFNTKVAIIHFVSVVVNQLYRIAGNFRGRKLSWISRFESHPRKFSPRNLGACRTYL